LEQLIRRNNFIRLCCGETSNDFKFVFNAFKKYNTDYNPNLLIADNAEAITNGFKSIFNSDRMKRFNCWAHVIRKVREKSNMIESKSIIEKNCLRIQPREIILETENTRPQQTHQKL
jgi:hypothetical protein